MRSSTLDIRAGDYHTDPPAAARTLGEFDGYQAWRQAAAQLADGPGARRGSAPLRELSVALLATHDVQLLAEILPLAALRHDARLTVLGVPFGQLEQQLADPSSVVRACQPDFIVFAGSTYDIIASSDGTHGEDDAVASACARWTKLWDLTAQTLRSKVVQLGFVPPADDAFADVAYTTKGSVSRLIRSVNTELARRAPGRVTFADLERTAARVGLINWHDPRYWAHFRQPCSIDAMPSLASTIAGVLAAESGLARRCVIVDLDNTLWGGEVGEDGVDGVNVGDGPDGEGYAAFQRYLRDIARRGLALAVASKNTPAVAQSALESVPGMVLRPSDFACVMADWRPKSEQIKEICRRLRLTPHNVVFVDDNPAELAEVRNELPAVETVQLPESSSLYVTTVANTPGLRATRTSDDDAHRAESYQAAPQIAELESRSATVEDFLLNLEMRATLRRADHAVLPRIRQLIGKTNQFNLTTRRHTDTELTALCEHSSSLVLGLRLRDRFADHGLVGCTIVRVAGTNAELDTLLLSCRIIGRTAERCLVSAAARWAKNMGCDQLIGRYRPTPRNAIVENLYPELGFSMVGRDGQDRLFAFDLSEETPPSSPFIREESP